MPKQLRIMRLLQRRRPNRRRAAVGRPVSVIESLEARTLLTNPLDSIPELNSLPDAPVSIYLDFDGNFESIWSGRRDVETPVYDIDDDETTFSDEELSRISQIWNLVAEDFRPFNVNVTTVDPGSFNNFESILVSIGGDGHWFDSSAAGSGGVAFTDGFNNSQSNTVFVFSDKQTSTGSTNRGVATFVAFTVSHEAGHAFGLSHQSEYDANGNKVDEYDPGTLRQGPLMGRGFSSERNTWTIGPSFSANVIQDTLAVMTRAANQTFAYRVDDYGNDQASATDVSFVDKAFEASGVIETNTDQDFFRIQPTAGTLDLSVEGLDLRPEFGGNVMGSNVDLVLRLFDANGNLIQESDPSNSIGASLSQLVEARTHYVEVTNTGEYGALGQFNLSGSLTTYVTPVITSPSGTIAARTPTFEWLPSDGSTIYELQVESVSNGQRVIDEVNIFATSFTPTDPLPQGIYQVRARGQNTDWGAYVQFTLDVPTPDQPVISSPSQNEVLGNPQVRIDWDDVANAVSYEVQLRNLRTEELRTLTNDVETSEFTLSEDLPDDPYRVWVRATNEVFEQSAFSTAVDFTVDAPTVARPSVTSPIGTVRDPNQTIRWDAVDGATHYELWVNGPTQSKLIYETDLTTTSFVIPETLEEGRYRTWVKAYNEQGEFGEWSLGVSFTVDVPIPRRPRVNGPATVSTTRQPVITWIQADNDAVAWELWVNDATRKTAKVIYVPRIEATEYTSGIALPDGEYHAWARAINGVGEYGGWSSRFEFEVNAAAQAAVPGLDTPILLGPNGASDSRESHETIFTWTNVANAQHYQLFIRDLETGEFQRIRADGQQTTENSHYSWAAPVGTYRAWVRAISPFGEVSEWSQAVSFSVLT